MKPLGTCNNPCQLRTSLLLGVLRVRGKFRLFEFLGLSDLGWNFSNSPQQLSPIFCEAVKLVPEASLGLARGCDSPYLPIHSLGTTCTLL